MQHNVQCFCKHLILLGLYLKFFLYNFIINKYLYKKYSSTIGQIQTSEIRRCNIRTLFSIIIIGIISLLLADEAALVKKVKGDVKVLRDGQELTVNVGTKIFAKDTIITSSKSSVGLIFKDETRISVGSGSHFDIEEYLFVPAKKQESFISNLKSGTIECITGLISKINPDSFKLKAKNATIGIRGTRFIVKVD